jgi:hypothetical protein
MVFHGVSHDLARRGFPFFNGLLTCLFRLVLAESLLRGRLPGQLELRSGREVLNVIFLVMRTGQRLAANVHLTTADTHCRADTQTAQRPPPGMPSLAYMPRHKSPPLKRTRICQPTVLAPHCRQTFRVRYNPHQGYRQPQLVDFHRIANLGEKCAWGIAAERACRHGPKLLARRFAQVRSMWESWV